jgi:hypothetical protein
VQVNLTRLDESNNETTTSLNLTRLITLDLSNNLMTGEIPATVVGRMQALETLDLSHNGLSGTIPSVLGELPELRRLWLRSNMFSGSIPRELGITPSLTLYVDRNQRHLEELDVSANLLVGTIPEELGNLNELSRLTLHRNNISGTVPPKLGRVPALRRLYMRHNYISGSIPKELTDAPRSLCMPPWGNPPSRYSATCSGDVAFGWFDCSILGTTQCEDVDECLESPCYNGVACTDAVAPAKGFTCDACPSGVTAHPITTLHPSPRVCSVFACAAGYQGDGRHCADIDDCASNPCGHGTCGDMGTNQYRCDCHTGYYNADVQNVTCLESMRCEREETATGTLGGCHRYGECTHLGPALRSCACRDGFSGDGYARPLPNTGGCTDTDACAPRPCFHDINGYASTCEDLHALCKPDDDAEVLKVLWMHADPYGPIPTAGPVGACEYVYNVTRDGSKITCDEGFDFFDTGRSFVELCPRTCSSDATWTGGSCTTLQAATIVSGVGHICGPCPSGFEGDGTTCTDIDDCVLPDGGNSCGPGTCLDLGANAYQCTYSTAPGGGRRLAESARDPKSCGCPESTHPHWVVGECEKLGDDSYRCVYVSAAD